MKPRIIETIRDLVVDCCDPEQIILFGSYAKGMANRESDVDLIVIGEFTASRWLRNRELLDLLSPLPVKVDAHLMTKLEVENESRAPHSFMSAALSSGIVIYER